MLQSISWLSNPSFKYDGAGYPNLDYKELIKHPEGIRMPRYHNQEGFIPYKAKWYMEDPADPEAPYFPTQGGTGKLEFDSPWLAEHDLPSLPVHDEPVESPYRTPELWEEYPFISHTRVHSHWSFLQYNLSSDGGFASDLVREADPTAAEPNVQLSPAAASKLGLEEGDMVWVESQHGKLQAKLLLSRRLPDWMVAVTYAWSGIMNKLNPMSVSPSVSGLKRVGPYGTGTWKGGGQNIMCGILCKVYKA
jgi:anaerobic selenocysteine-containing dehydrogenase